MRFVGALLVLSLLPLVGPAHAQAEEAAWLEIGDPVVAGLPVQPDLGRGQVMVPWTYHSPRTVEGGLTTKGALVWDEMSCASAVLVTGVRSQLVDGASTNGTVWGNATFDILATQAAPAEQPIPCVLAAHVEAQDSRVPLSEVATVGFNVTVAFLGLVSVTVPETMTPVRPGATVAFPVNVTNLGNAPARLALSWVEVSAGHFTPRDLPSDVVLDRDETREVDLPFRAAHGKGSADGEQVAILLVTPHSALTGETGHARTVDLVLLAPRRPADAATLHPAFGVLAVAALAVGSRRAASR